MKYALLFSALISTQAFAHGPVASQASTAVAKATALFLQQSPEIQDKFQSVSSAVIGEERFNVVMKLNDGAEFAYVCGLDETTTPISWGCKN